MNMNNIVHLVFRHIQQNRVSIAWFIIVGTLCAGVHLSSFQLLWKIAHVHYQVAVSIAYVLSVLVHFFANRQVVFKNHTTELAVQLPRYIFMLAINYLVTLLVVSVAVEILSLQPIVGIVLAIGCTVNVSYLLSRFWVFRSSDKGLQSE